MARTITLEIKLDTKQAEAQLAGFQRKFSSALDSNAQSAGKFRSAIGASTVAITALGAAGVLAFKRLAETALQAAISLDKTRSTIAAMTGSIGAANAKLAELRKISQESVGVTNQLATSTFAIFKATGDVADKTINNLIRGMGRLNAAFGLDDPQGFARNLQQIFQQGFERSDIKEALGRVPIFEQLLESAFGTKDPDKLRKLKAAGKLTMEAFAAGIADAIENNPILKSIPESIGAKFDKLKDRLMTAIAPVGDLIANVLLIATNRLAGALEGIGSKSENSFARFRFALLETVKQTDVLIARVATLGSSLTEGVRRLINENNIVSQQLGSATIGFLNDLLEGKNPLAEGSRANTIGRRNFLANRGGDPANIAGAPSRRGLLLQGVDPKAVTNRTSQIGGGGGGGAVARLSRAAQEMIEMREKIARGNAEFIEQAVKDLQDLDKDLQAINLTAEAVRRQRPPDLEALPKLRLIAPPIPETPGSPLRSLMEEAAQVPEKTILIMSDVERLMLGVNSAIETVGDSFERFGANVARAFGNVRDLFNGLKSAVLGFFNDLLGNTLQNLVKNTLGALFGGSGGGGSFGGLFNNLFRTPSLAGGGGLSAPSSVSGFGGTLGRLFSGGGASPLAFPGAQSPEFFNVAGGVGGSSFLGGIGQSFAAAAPLLGLGLGAGLGGSSIGGQILGSAGGALGGLVLGASTGALKGSLAAAFKLSGALGPAALIAAPLLIGGAILLGKAKQRKKDEQASGEMLTQALQAIAQLRVAVASGQVDGSQARQIFESEILGDFIRGINSLKTKSVRESRLTNQVRDLRKVFDDSIPGAIAEQMQKQQNAIVNSKLIPEFASGGITRGGLAVLHPQEMVLTRQHQAAIRNIAGANVFDRVGVPGVQQNARFDRGGIMPGDQHPGDIVIEQLTIGISAEEIFVAGGRGARGRNVVVNNIKTARTNREL